MFEPINGQPLFFGDDGILIVPYVPEAEANSEVPGEPGRAAELEPLVLRRWDVSGKVPRTVGSVPFPQLEGITPRPILATGPGVVTMRSLGMIVGENREGELVFWRLVSTGDAMSCKLPLPRESELHPVAVSADGTVFAAGLGDSGNRIIKVWSITGNVAQERASIQGAALPARIQLTGPTGEVVDGGPGEDRPLNVWQMALAPDGRSVALADNEGTIQVWSLAESEPLLRASLVAHKVERVAGAVQRLAFSGDGQQLVTIGSDRKLMAWDIADSKAIYTASFPDVVNDAGFAPDDRHIVTSNPDGTIYILRLPQGP